MNKYNGEILLDDIKNRLKAGEPYTIVVDFDGTLSEQTINFPYVEEKTELLDLLVDMKKKYPNIILVLWTCREGKDLEIAVNFCKEYGLEFDAINEDHPANVKWKGHTRKPFGNIYIDDRALSPKDAMFLYESRLYNKCEH